MPQRRTKDGGGINKRDEKVYSNVRHKSGCIWSATPSASSGNSHPRNVSLRMSTRTLQSQVTHVAAQEKADSSLVQLSLTPVCTAAVN